MRCNDEYHCSCGLAWDIDEDDPHEEIEEGDDSESSDSL